MTYPIDLLRDLVEAIDLFLVTKRDNDEVFMDEFIRAKEYINLVDNSNIS